MLERLESIRNRYEELNRLLSDPDTLSDSKKLRKYSKEQSDLEPKYHAYCEYKEVSAQYADAKEMLDQESDPEMVEMVKGELVTLEKRKVELEEAIRILLLPRDPNDDKNVIVEIRGAAGGDEAALFAADLYRMYTRYGERQGWKSEVMEANATGMGGFKEIIFSVQGQGAYSRLKYESGAHRVQRVPATESGGRIHTSTATVAMLPEAEEVDIDIHDKDIRIDTFCSSGPGGQSVNTTKSAVRITHIPTGVVVSCQDEKSQIKNKDKAMRVLRARLLDRKQQEEAARMADARKTQVGTGDRSERIRTYNFPQSRVTDHRIGLTLHKLDMVLDGELDEVIDALVLEEQSALLKNAE
ncbi:peptide chain release factor 1 [Marininema halotolerans]|uniref:Peptide chain release factor 1 n=1 Tax=Marininema halotolerans TaxID=1155944 RepID=A0A1I6P490_9BACL|nr:peptide chain release factor 1 [Marininema halotolerans]SFS34908.1 peptide chain release factor 1 [Marininema halotolerans]